MKLPMYVLAIFFAILGLWPFAIFFALMGWLAAE